MGGALAQGIRNTHMPDLGEAARSQIVERVRHIDILQAELAVVGVTGEKDHADGAAVADQLEQPRLIAREIDPSLPARKIGQHLQARANQTQIGRLA